MFAPEFVPFVPFVLCTFGTKRCTDIYKKNVIMYDWKMMMINQDWKRMELRAYLTYMLWSVSFISLYNTIRSAAPTTTGVLDGYEQTDVPLRSASKSRPSLLQRCSCSTVERCSFGILLVQMGELLIVAQWSSDGNGYDITTV